MMLMSNSSGNKSVADEVIPEFDTFFRVAQLFPSSILMSYLNFPKNVVNKFVRKFNELH